MLKHLAAKLLTLSAALLLAACGGHSSGGDSQPATVTYSIGGGISGLSAAGLVLQNNGADNLTVAANAASFKFAMPIAKGGTYNVTVAMQPAGLICTVSHGTGTNVQATITAIDIVCSATTFSVGGTVAGLTANGLVLQNNAGDDLTIAANATTFQFATPIAYDSGYAVTILTQPSGQSCSLANATGNNVTAQINNVAISCAQTALTASVSSLALAVNCPSAGGSCAYANAALTGNARQIIITNVSSTDTTTQLTVTPTSFPTGTAITSDSCTGTNLAPLSSCSITVTPGQIATSSCTSGIAPIPTTVSVNASNAPNAAIIDVVILNYGCNYQGGFVYSIDDTTATTGSIGGKVAALNDLAEPYINSGPQLTSIIWSSNGTSSVSSDIIPGVDETSTPGTGSPTYVAAQSAFNASYLNTGILPFPSSNSFTTCNGGTDGACNSANVFALYDSLITNFSSGCDSGPGGSGGGCTLSAGITPRTNYAAAQCSAANSGGYADWYLPAVCEMGPASNGSGCAVGEQNMVDNLPFLLGDASDPSPTTSCSPPTGASCLAGYYWSSTQFSANPRYDAWSQYFSSSGGSAHIPNDKSALQGTRCSRGLTH